MDVCNIDKSVIQDLLQGVSGK